MTGKVTTQGDQILKADIARQLFGLDGKGIKVGIISDSFNSLSGLSENVKSGDLPGNANPFGYRQPVTILADSNKPLSDEGRALGQIIHDIAPGAELFFHTFTQEDRDDLFSDEESFAKAVSTLTAAGVDIIVEDAVIPASLLQDGKAAKAIEAAINQGVVVVSAAGNNGGISYESVFRPGAEFELEGLQFQAHDFDPTDGVDFFQNINLPQENTLISPLFGWDDPIGEIKTEYVQFLVNTPELPNPDNIVAVSGATSESAVDVPLQVLGYAPEKDEQLYFVIAKVGDDVSKKPTFIKWVSGANGADRKIDYEYIDEDANNKSVYGYSNAPSSITVGATDIDNPTEVRSYSSRGGSPILFDAEGNRLANPIFRNKPEIYAPDGVATNFPIDSPLAEFFGTSASAPHIAGIVALMLDRADGNLTPEEIRTRIQDTALSIEEGSGLVQADRAVIESFVSEEIGSDFTDFLHGTNSADNIYGNKGADLLRGCGGQDYLVGGDGIDILLGDNGNDVLDGGKDNDILIGGKGADRFVLRPGDGQDKILDYRHREDFFILEGLTFEQLTIMQGNFSTSIKVTDTQERLAELIIGTQTDMIGAEDFIVLA
jgi:subtilisin family serine protease